MWYKECMAIRFRYIDKQGVGHISLTQGKEALVDAEWLAVLGQYRWSANHEHNRWYAIRAVNGKRVAMHQVVLGAPEGVKVDHRDRSPEGGLDNRIANLRLASPSQNGYNRGKLANNTSGYKGAYWHKASGKYSSQIAFNGRLIHLGLFRTAIEAAAVYNFAATRLHGEFAALNDLSSTEAI